MVKLLECSDVALTPLEPCTLPPADDDDATNTGCLQSLDWTTTLSKIESLIVKTSDVFVQYMRYKQTHFDHQAKYCNMHTPFVALCCPRYKSNRELPNS